MILTDKQQEIINNYINGNISIFRENIKNLSKKELIDFCYNVQEQSIYTANEILSICFKYL
jgi:hypothetical protein